MHFCLGLRDNRVARSEMMEHLAPIVAACDLPVSADLENGFGDAPETVAQTISMAAEPGAVSGSIEDATGRPDAPLYEVGLAVERIAAAAEVARSRPVPFTLTARAECFLVGLPHLDEVIRRLHDRRKPGSARSRLGGCCESRIRAYSWAPAATGHLALRWSRWISRT